MARKKKNYTTAGITQREANKRLESNRAVRKTSYEKGIELAKQKRHIKALKQIKKTKALDDTYTMLRKAKKSLKKKPYGSAGGYN